MADRRLYRVESPEGDVQTAMIVVRRVLARCARPPISLSARGTLARPAAVAAIAAAAPRARVEAVLDVPPAEPGRLAATLREQPLDAWFAEQAASGFGSAFWIGSDRDEPRASQLTLSFTAEPGQEQAERPRAERWLSALAEAGLLPSAASPERVAAWFFTHVRAEPGHPPPNPSPGTVQNDVRIRSFGWRGTADRPPVYGPAAIELTVPLPPPVALARAVPLLDAGGPIRFNGYFDADPRIAAALADLGECHFDFEIDPLPEPVPDALLTAADDDLIIVEWCCDWPGESSALNGVVLGVNATYDGSPYDPLPLPGAATVHLGLHPRANGRDPEAYARQLAELAGVRLAVG
ncbi:hypothetical protein OG417_38675 [Actinoallomurus sp. NBC_01490]|uniref:hypothetical protein n=1 Tax=Actinoallomurus sp. NBC_01490 TaxID=2903557 RepID=UPI002E2FC849|nr:hypothetical protein [Actinoallomurus sp. NBC_01490]